MKIKNLLPFFLTPIFFLCENSFGIKTWEALDFPIMGWRGPPTRIVRDSIFQDVMDAGFTANFNGYFYSEVQSVDIQRIENKRMLAVAERVGLKLLIMDTRIDATVTPDAAAYARLDSVILDYKDSPALLGYHIIDEPTSDLFANIALVKNYLLAKDPDRLAYVNLNPNWAPLDFLGSTSYPAHVEDFIKAVQPQVLTYDNYGITSSGLRDGYYQNLENIRSAALAHKIPFWAFTLSTPHGPYPMPTEGHIRFQLYSDLAYGAQGLQYYTYGATVEPLGPMAPVDAKGTKTTIWYMAQKINLEILKLAPVLKTLTSTAVYHSLPLPLGTRLLPASSPISNIDIAIVMGFFKTPKNLSYVMLVNRDYTNAKTGNITVADSVQGLVEVSKLDGKETALLAKNGQSQIKLEFKAGEGRLFRIIDPTSLVIPESKKQFSLPSIGTEPNPFNSGVSIRYWLPPDFHGGYRINDLQGQLMYTADLYAGHQGSAGTLDWNGLDKNGRRPISGLFVGSLETVQGKVASHKFLLAK